MLRLILLLFVLGEIEARDGSEAPTIANRRYPDLSRSPRGDVAFYVHKNTTGHSYPHKEYGSPSRTRLSLSSPCDYPRFENGRVRGRQRSKLIKFMCSAGYELVGNKYATCKYGEWDVPMPVCVKPGCPPIHLENGIQIPSREGAWVLFFCMPGYSLVGSSALYCNGRRWNGTEPTCAITATPSKLSCDFEDPDLCGWTQDELHDFDWKRLNQKTPSSFLFTGPSFDHTLGEDGTGHYMYIESTSRLENDTARLISPIYDGSLAKNGCLEFFYHMFGKTTGGLRVFQKPESFGLQALLQLSDSDRQKYTLFEKWGNQGDVWLNAVTPLSDLGDSFQIVIEGIRGKSFTSDIAVDDVSLLQGARCEAATRVTTTTPAADMPDTCLGRCNMFGVPTVPDGAVCECTAVCITDGSCCPDFLELCVFDSTASADDNAPAEPPQTQKLVASTITTMNTTPSTTTDLKSTTTTDKPTTFPPTTNKLLTISVTTTTKQIPKVVVTTAKPTKLPKTSKLVTSTTKLPTLVFKTTTPVYNGTGRIQKDVSKKPAVVNKPTTKPTTTEATRNVVTTTPVPFKASTVGDRIDKIKREKEDAIQAKKFISEKVIRSHPEASSGVNITLLTLAVLLATGGLVWLIVWGRSAGGRQAIARLRGRSQHDPEVRYLNADIDD